jgi:hypothetical protein
VLPKLRANKNGFSAFFAKLRESGLLPAEVRQFPWKKKHLKKQKTNQRLPGWCSVI